MANYQQDCNSIKYNMISHLFAIYFFLSLFGQRIVFLPKSINHILIAYVFPECGQKTNKYDIHEMSHKILKLFFKQQEKFYGE